MAPNSPYPEYPHIIKLENNYIELRCPFCQGNARGDNPHDFISAPTSLVVHINKHHLVARDPKVNQKSILAPGYLRVLDDNEVSQIEAGNGTAVITKKVLVDGPGKQALPPKSNAVIGMYPTIVEKAEGGYGELKCYKCGANARRIRGNYNSPRLIFFQGVLGLKTHLRVVHKKEDMNRSAEWVTENCGTPIDDQRFQQLKNDHRGQLIQKVVCDQNEEPAESDHEGEDGEGQDELLSQPKPRRSKLFSKKKAGPRKRAHSSPEGSTIGTPVTASASNKSKRKKKRARSESSPIKTNSLSAPHAPPSVPELANPGGESDVEMDDDFLPFLNPS